MQQQSRVKACFARTVLISAIIDQDKFDAVFMTGLVRNNTSRNSLPPEIGSAYKAYCEQLVAQAGTLPPHMLYERAGRFLEHLLEARRRKAAG